MLMTFVKKNYKLKNFKVFTFKMESRTVCTVPGLQLKKNG
jgi:hypothetical protein